MRLHGLTIRDLYPKERNGKKRKKPKPAKARSVHSHTCESKPIVNGWAVIPIRTSYGTNSKGVQHVHD